MTVSKNPIQNLLTRLDYEADGVVLIYENQSTTLDDVKYVYDLLNKALREGTLVISGDSGFNQYVSVRKGMRRITNQQRLVIASGKLLQLFMLENDVHFAKHPGLILGAKGKFSRFIARNVDLDFPYGPESIFNDLYELNAFILFAGMPGNADCIRLVNTRVESPIITKNTSIIDGDVKSFLDYDYDVKPVIDALKNSTLLLSEQVANTTIYGVRYRDLIEFALSIHK